MNGLGDAIASFFVKRFEDVTAYPGLAVWYVVLVTVGWVECQWVPTAVESVGASPIMRSTYIALGYAAVLAEICCLDFLVRHFSRGSLRAWLVLPLFILALNVTKQADLITYSREQNERVTHETVLRDRFVASTEDEEEIRRQVRELNASVPGGLLTVADYDAQIAALETRRDDGKWKPQSEEREIADDLRVATERRGQAARRDLLQSPAQGEVASTADPVRDPAKDWDTYIAVVQPIARFVTQQQVVITPTSGAQIFGFSIMLFSAGFLTVGASASMGLSGKKDAPRAPKQRTEPKSTSVKATVFEAPVEALPPPRTPSVVMPLPGPDERAARRVRSAAPAKSYGWGPVRKS